LVNLATIFNLQLTLFALTAVGMFAWKKGIITESSRTSITNLLINIILPCNIIASFRIEMTWDVFFSTLAILAVSFAIQFFYLFLNKFLYSHAEKKKRVVMQYATICSNAAFIGLPVIGGIFGAQGALYTSIALIPQRIFMWSAGLSLFTVTDRKTIILNLLKHPCVNAIWIGFALMLIRWNIPEFANRTINSLSGCTAAVSMIIIGCILAEIDFKSSLNKLILYFTFLRLVVIPVVILVILKFFQLPDVLIGVMVLMAGMPAGSTTAILASKYDGDAEFASKCVFVSTLLSMVTIPLLAFLL
jgi:malate permease and related proteins